MDHARAICEKTPATYLNILERTFQAISQRASHMEGTLLEFFAKKIACGATVLRTFIGDGLPIIVCSGYGEQARAHTRRRPTLAPIFVEIKGGRRTYNKIHTYTHTHIYIYIYILVVLIQYNTIQYNTIHNTSNFFCIIHDNFSRQYKRPAAGEIF